MAGKKNSSLSDKALEKVAGGYIEYENGFFGIYDNDTNQFLFAIFPEENLRESRYLATEIDQFYHEGKAKGYEKGYNDGKKNAGQLGNIDNNI